VISRDHCESTSYEPAWKVMLVAIVMFCRTGLKCLTGEAWTAHMKTETVKRPTIGTGAPRIRSFRLYHESPEWRKACQQSKQSALGMHATTRLLTPRRDKPKARPLVWILFPDHRPDLLPHSIIMPQRKLQRQLQQALIYCEVRGRVLRFQFPSA
jgi:hypothetical protein